MAQKQVEMIFLMNRTLALNSIVHISGKGEFPNTFPAFHVFHVHYEQLLRLLPQQ